MSTQTRARTTARPARKPVETAAIGAAGGSLIAAAGVAALAGTAYFFRRELMALLGYQRIHVAPHIREHLPIAKDLPTIPDFDGNYDMDGVSFDSEGVIVGSDLSSHAHPQTPHDLA